jgi:energy-coupling factor transporter ATPase
MVDKKKFFIRVENVYYSYEHDGEQHLPCTRYALSGIDLEIKSGEYLALVGANGSGKSTLLRHLNGLLIPSSGNVRIRDWNTRGSSHIRDIRRSVGMVFQVPETQIVATIVEEDVAFGPENLGIPAEELQKRVAWALDEVGLTEYRKRPTHFLSAGQKQLLSIASTLSMTPECLLLDEATSMLDPGSRKRLLQTVSNLHKRGMTVVMATHNMEEASMAGRVVVLSQGSIVMQGPPREVFSQINALSGLKIRPPIAMQIAMKIAKKVRGFPADILTIRELVSTVKRYCIQTGETVQ